MLQKICYDCLFIILLYRLLAKSQCKKFLNIRCNINVMSVKTVICYYKCVQRHIDAAIAGWFCDIRWLMLHLSYIEYIIVDFLPQLPYNGADV